MEKKTFRFFILIVFVIIPVQAFSQVNLPAIFTNNMVLQQQSDIPIWGKARSNKEIRITTSWDSQTYTVKSDIFGKWSVKVKTPAAGGPYEITFTERNTTKLKNVMIGEVWICSGQSNMEMPLAGWGKILDYEKEISEADYPDIRLIQVKKTASVYPIEDVTLDTKGWVNCSSETVENFSSTAYFFGREIYKNLNIPIGLIHTSWGGTVAEAWTSKESLSMMPDFLENLKEINELPKDRNELEKIVQQKIEKWNSDLFRKDFGFYKGNAVVSKANFDDSHWEIAKIPGLWENDVLPNFDGVVWFRKVIEIPNDWDKNRLILSLGMVDDNDITYINGVEIGKTSGYDVERKYRIPANLILDGKAIITVRVTDTGGGGGFHGESENLFIAQEGSDFLKINLAGEWKYKKSVEMKDVDPFPQQILDNPNFPTNLYNAMIAPLIPFKIRGAIWYQGESNAGRADQYRTLFPLMINDWRKKWDDDFPFYFVQLANFMQRKDVPLESNWAELRDAQLNTLHLTKTGMAVTIDIGDAGDIHPKNKQDVGKRLAYSALEKTYGRNIVGSGPIYESYKIENGRIRIVFEENISKLKSNAPKLIGFSIAGPDKVFHWAEAMVEGDNVIVYSPKVEFPIAVRYAWADNPDCNLYNDRGLPASPFRTDNWD